MIDWHRLSGKRSVALVLMIAMSNMSIKLTAGNFFELSLSTFGDVSNAILMFIIFLEQYDSYVVRPTDRWLKHLSLT